MADTDHHRPTWPLPARRRCPTAWSSPAPSSPSPSTADEARAAVERRHGAQRPPGPARAPGRGPLSPTSGSSPRSRTLGELPGGRPGRHHPRACSGPASVRPCARSGRASGSRPSRCPTPGPAPRIEALARELRVVLEEVAELRRLAAAARDPAHRQRSRRPGRRRHLLGRRLHRPQARPSSRPPSWASGSSWCWRGPSELLAELQVARQIRHDVTEGMEKQQRDFLLRQQLAAIRKELGEGDDDGADDYRAQRRPSSRCPTAVRTAVDKEIDRLERTSGQQPRAGLDPHLARPRARAAVGHHHRRPPRPRRRRATVLDADHYGLDDVKDRIVEFLAVRKLRAERADGADGRPPTATPVDRPAPACGAIIALVGPPGVGKTSLGESRGPGHGPQRSCGSPSAASATRPRSAATAAPTSAPSPAASCGPSPRPAR